VVVENCTLEEYSLPLITGAVITSLRMAWRSGLAAGCQLKARHIHVCRSR